jgi:ribosomal protein L37AE/L43A
MGLDGEMTPAMVDRIRDIAAAESSDADSNVVVAAAAPNDTSEADAVIDSGSVIQDQREKQNHTSPVSRRNLRLEIKVTHLPICHQSRADSFARSHPRIWCCHRCRFVVCGCGCHPRLCLLLRFEVLDHDASFRCPHCYSLLLIWSSAAVRQSRATMA